MPLLFHDMCSNPTRNPGKFGSKVRFDIARKSACVVIDWNNLYLFWGENTTILFGAGERQPNLERESEIGRWRMEVGKEG
jgi:hypothetical protein